MDDNYLEQVRITLNQKSTEELRQIWEENDRKAWSDEAFEAIEQILEERGEAPGPQTQPTPPDELTQAPALQRPGCVTAYVLLTAIGSVLYLLFSIGGVVILGGDAGSYIAVGTALIMAVLVIAVSIGLWRMNNWARIVTIVLQCFNLFLSIALLFGGLFTLPTILGLLVGGITIYWFATNGRYFIKQGAA